MSRYLKISKICGYENHEACGFDPKTTGIHRIDGIKMTLPTKIVTPLAYPTNTFASFNDAGTGCQTYAGEHYKVPNRDELGSLYFNGILINQINGGYFWTSEAFTEDEGWTLYFSSGYRVPFARSHGYNVRCVRK